MFDEDTADGDDLVGVFVDDDGCEVVGLLLGGVVGAEEVETGLVGCETGVGYDCEDGENAEMSSCVVCSRKGADLNKTCVSRVTSAREGEREETRTWRSECNSRLTCTGIRSGWNNSSSSWSGVHFGYCCCC